VQALNVVFDLGGVVLTCNPYAVVSSVFDDSGTRALVLERVFGDPDWVEFDRGTLSRERFIERAAERTGIEMRALEELFDALPGALVPVPDVVELIKALRASGNRQFVLSNMHRASLAHLEAAYDIFALFDGRIVSCEVGACKPESAIYRRLLESFALDPRATVLIDDVEANLDAAAAHGMQTIRFESLDGCRAELVAMGCI